MSIEEFVLIESYILTEPISAAVPVEIPESEYDAQWYPPRADGPRRDEVFDFAMDEYSDLEPVEYDMDDEPKKLKIPDQNTLLPHLIPDSELLTIYHDSTTNKPRYSFDLGDCENWQGYVK